jgi:phage gp29-like protein
MASTLPGELATTRSDPFVPIFQTTMQPTDEILVANGGASAYKVYDEIRRDPHAHAILQKRKLEVISREWQVFGASERRIDKRIAAECEQILKTVNFDSVTGGLLGAVLKGFSVGETIWLNEAGIWKPVQVKVKKQRRFRFDVDGKLRMLTRSSPVEGEEVPDRKFIVHRHSIDDDDDDPYGVGLGSVLFWPAWFKRQVLANWLQATRKHAAPTTLAQYQGAFDKTKQDQLGEALSAMQGADSLVVPENVKVDLLEAKANGNQSEGLARYLDELMSEAVLGETLTTNSGERGARSLGDIHNEIRIAIAKADADLVCKTIQQSLLRWYVEINYPGEAVPEVWRDFSESEDLNDKVERDKKIYEMGYKPASVDYINDTYGGEWIERQAAGQPVIPGQDQGDATAGLAFADTVRPEAASQQAVRQISDQMAEFGRTAIDAMVGEIRSAFSDAISYDDLIERLARLSGDLSIEELAQVMTQGTVLADLEGRASADG